MLNYDRLLEIGKSTKENGTLIGEHLKSIKLNLIISIEENTRFYTEVIKYVKHSKKKEKAVKYLNLNKENLNYLKNL